MKKKPTPMKRYAKLMKLLALATPVWQTASMNQKIMLKNEKVLLLRSIVKELKTTHRPKTRMYETKSISVMLLPHKKRRGGEV